MQDDNTGGVRTGKPSTPGPSVGSGRPRPGDPLAPNGRIGAQLRALYDEIEREPIPEDLLDLLEKLDEAEKKQEDR
jgi:Anti-sigma factor NepR